MPIASLEPIVAMKLIVGRSQDLADVEAIVESGDLRATVSRAIPDRIATLDRLFENVDQRR